MPQFYASTSKGLAEVLSDELKELGISGVRQEGAGAVFEDNWEACYRVNLCSRVASRVLKPILDFYAYHPDEIFQAILKHDFTKHIQLPFSLKVEASVADSKIYDQRIVALKVKDAICDQFRDAFGTRPDVDKERPDLRIYIRGFKNQFNVAIDTSGESLYRRGYRLEAGEAPLRENLGAGLLRLMSWDQNSPIVDPMCGSGTLLIEAALMKFKIPPGGFRKRFGFQSLKTFQAETWAKVMTEAFNQEIEPEKGWFYGFDSDRKALTMAKANAARAGMDDAIEFKYGNVTTLMAPEVLKAGSILTNPPYGVRWGDEHELKDVYRDFAHTLKRQFIGWDAWVLSGHRELTQEMKLKSTKRFNIQNGPLECRFLQYPVKSHGL